MFCGLDSGSPSKAVKRFNLDPLQILKAYEYTVPSSFVLNTSPGSFRREQVFHFLIYTIIVRSLFIVGN